MNEEETLECLEVDGIIQWDGTYWESTGKYERLVESEKLLEDTKTELLLAIRFHNAIMESSDLKHCHHDSKVCLEVLNPIYHSLTSKVINDGY